jgi:hypothetical protein
MARTRTRTGFGQPVKPARGRPRGFGRPVKEPFLKRTRDALKDSARDRAELARRRLAMKLKGHKHSCRCGKTFYTQTGRDACANRHEREARARTKARTGPARTKNPVRPGHHSCAGCGKRFRNDLQLNDHARQHAEREDRARKRQTEQGRRTQAVNARAKRGGRPNGAPKNRGQRDGRTRDERRAEWHAHRMQHAAGRVDRDGNRVPHQPSPRKVQPRARVAPNVR